MMLAAPKDEQRAIHQAELRPLAQQQKREEREKLKKALFGNTEQQNSRPNRVSQQRPARRGKYNRTYGSFDSKPL